MIKAPITAQELFKKKAITWFQIGNVNLAGVTTSYKAVAIQVISKIRPCKVMS